MKARWIKEEEEEVETIYIIQLGAEIYQIVESFIDYVSCKRSNN